MSKNINQPIAQKRFSSKFRSQDMMPILQPNDLIYYQKTSLRQCKINDFIMFQKGQKLFTHRIIYKTKSYLITKGDNNLQSDGKIFPQQIIAKVYQVKRSFNGLKRGGQIFNHESLYLFQSILYFQEIIKIKKAFETENINFVFLKGSPLHLYFEKNLP
jgi:signal peptidase I